MTMTCHSSMTATINIAHGGNTLNNVTTLMLALLTIFMTTHCRHSHKQVKHACACIIPYLFYGHSYIRLGGSVALPPHAS